MSFFSYRTKIPRHFDSHANVRSTTHRRGLWPCDRSQPFFSSPIRRMGRHLPSGGPAPRVCERDREVANRGGTRPTRAHRQAARCHTLARSENRPRVRAKAVRNHVSLCFSSVSRAPGPSMSPLRMSHINRTRPRQGLQLVIRRVAGSQISHIFRRASAGSEALPSLARRVSMQQHAKLPCRGNRLPDRSAGAKPPRKVRKSSRKPNDLSLHRSHSALGAYFRRMNSRLGYRGAITATAHKLPRYAYVMLKHGEAYVSQSLEQYETATQERIERTLPVPDQRSSVNAGGGGVHGEAGSGSGLLARRPL